MLHGLQGGRALEGLLPGVLPIGDGRVGQPRLRIVMRHQCWLRRDDLRELGLQHLRNALMVVLAGAPQQGLIRGILDQRVLEEVCRLRRQPPLIQQFRRHQAAAAPAAGSSSQGETACSSS